MEDFTLKKKSRFNNRFYYLFISLLISVSGFSQNVGINSTGAQPNASAGLDVDFPGKGLLIPRVSLTSTTSFAPLSAHVAGMVVYNIATVGDVTPGFYCDNGSKWIPGFVKGQSLGDMLYWSGAEWLRIPIGVPGQYLQISGSIVPTWGGNIFATLSTTSASAITATTATSGGNVISDGGSAVLSRGVCWNTLGAPTIANSKTSDVPGTGVYSSNITGLLSGTTYHVRAYAMNSNVINYGNEITFTTIASTPALATTTSASSITGSTAVSGGNITSDGGSPIIERGVCFATTSSPTILNNKIIDVSSGVGLFVSNLTGLSGGTLYYVRSYATNGIGTTYGTQISFTTSVAPPTLVTVAASNITGTSVSSGASMTWNGGGYTNFQAYGVAYSTVSNSTAPTYFATNSSNGSVNPNTPIAPWTTNITGLIANTTYYIRSYLNLYKTGTGWVTVFGNELTFTTSGPTAPVLTSTSAITGLSANAAISGGVITSDGGSPITAKGVCWGLSANPVLGVGNFTTNGSGTANFVSNISGLTASTLYYVRSYATNSIGTSYGPADVSFTTWVQAPYTLGQNLNYGYCAYVAPDGSGFIVSYDIPSTAPWGGSGTSIATSTALGSGLANTNLILATIATRPIAASVAASYTGGGFTDWYLPSSGDWGKIGAVANMVGIGSSLNNYYTSSQTSATYAASWFTNYNSGYASGASKLAGSNDYVHQLRAIRNFSPATLASVTTKVISNVGAGSATGGGNVTGDGGAPIIAGGVCWSTSTNPTIANSKTNDATTTGSFVSNLNGLTIATTYYVRAYVTNVAGTSYGSQVSFTTAASASSPTVSTDIVTVSSGTDATGGGNVTSDGGDPVTVRGICWSTTASPTTSDNITTDGSGIGAFVSGLTNLTPGETYYVRAYATNGIGTSYGNEVSFGAGLATVIADETSIVTAGSIAAIYSWVSSDAGDAVTETGLCWSSTSNPTIADSHTTDLSAQYNYFSDLNNLTVGVTYYVRAYAVNSLGTAYSSEISFIASSATVGQYIPSSSGYDGVIISTDGTNGLIASAWDFGPSDWACTSSVTGASGTAVGTGLSNSNTIMADITLNGCTSASTNSYYGLFAAEVPASIIGSEWYLPSKDEVDVIYSSLVTTNLPISGLHIWSSSEVDATNAWYFDGTTWQNTGLKSDDTNYIWPIRSF